MYCKLLLFRKHPVTINGMMHVLNHSGRMNNNTYVWNMIGLVYWYPLGLRKGTVKQLGSYCPIHTIFGVTRAIQGRN